MANEEKMNVDIENQENFEKKKKIIVISLSAALVFITLIAGLFLVKKNKESRYENNDLGEVVDENNDNNNNNNNNNDHENDDVIVNEGDYFFNKTSGQVITNILLSLFTGVLFFFWENDKIPDDKNKNVKLWLGCDKKFLLCIDSDNKNNIISNAYCGVKEKNEKNRGGGIFEKENLFGFASLGFLIVITFLVELVLHLLIGSISYFFSKDKNKRYFHTLKISIKKREQIFSSLSKTKTFFIVLSYLLCGFAIAIAARAIARKLNPCCECWNADGEIITGHNIHCCLGYCEVEYQEHQKKINEDNNKKNNDNSDSDSDNGETLFQQ